MLSSNDTQIKVVCRIRPLNQLEISQGGQIAVNYNDKTIKIKVQGDENKNEFTFDHIFGPETKQTQVFKIVAKPIVDSVMKGFNGTIFAYGQTSSGKTFTMEGPAIDSDENKGIIPRMMDEVFDGIMKANENIEFTVKVSFLEIYNEKIHDLLDTRKNNLHIKEDRNRGIYVQDATEIYVNNVDQMKRVMKTGADNRTIAATKMNERSSRSHSIFILSLFQKDLENDTTKQSSLFFVDLAGSEKIAKTHVTGQQLEEAKNINKSLSALGNVINALTSEKKEHIPYRDSKLTRILQESLGGNSKTSLILACSPCTYNDKETLGTLKFGNRAKSIKNTPIINEEKSTKELKHLLEQAEHKIQQQELIIEKLESELKKSGQNDIELKIVEELEKAGSSSTSTTNTNESKPEIKTNYEQISSSTTVKPITKAPSSNNSLKLLKQHILINSLNEENKLLKLEKKELEKDLMNRNKEIYSLNDKVNQLEDDYNNLWKIHSDKMRIYNLRIEKLFHENQVTIDIFLKLKTDLSRIKADFNFLLLSDTLKTFESMFENDNNANNKQQIIENIQKTVELISSIELFFDEKSMESLSKLISNEKEEEIILQTPSKALNELEIENSMGELYSGSEDNFMSPNKKTANLALLKPLKKSLFVNLTQKTEEDEGIADIYPKSMLTDGDYIDEKEKDNVSSSGANNEGISSASSKSRVKTEDEQTLITYQKKIIGNLNKTNKEISSKLEHVNNIVAEKVKKYKEKIKKITENTGIKEIDLQNKINSLNEIIREKEVEMQKNQAKFEKEINVKTQELNEMKIHLDQFQKFIVGKKPTEAKSLLEFEKKIRDLGQERQKLFNEITVLRKENDDKNKDISEKSKQIFSLQSKLTNLTTENQALLKENQNLKTLKSESSPSRASKDSPRKSKEISALSSKPKIKRSSKEHFGFIDKHIIKPIRGGGGDLTNFQRKNLMLASVNSSESEEEMHISSKETMKNENNAGLPTEEKCSTSTNKQILEPNLMKQWTLQQSFRAFDNFVKKSQDQQDKKCSTIETKRILNKADSMFVDNLVSPALKGNKMQLSLMDEENDDDKIIIDELNQYNQAQKQDVERKFKHIKSSNLVVLQKNQGGAQTSKNLFNKLKKFFV